MNAPRITQAELEDRIDHVEYVKHVTPRGQVLRWCVITLDNGYAVTGKPSVAVSPENDNEKIGKEMAYAAAEDAIWPLLGFLLKDKLWTGNAG